MMLRYSFDLTEEADCIENAVSGALAKGYRTKDIAAAGEEDWLSGNEMKDRILELI